MTARRKAKAQVPPPTNRTHSVMASQPVLDDVAPVVRQQEGEYLFVAIGPSAANRRQFGDDGAQGNVAMLLTTIVYILAIAAVVAVAGFFAIKHYDHPLVRVAFAGLLVGALSVELFDRIRNRRIRIGGDWA